MDDKAMAEEAFSENEWFVLDETDPVDMDI